MSPKVLLNTKEVNIILHRLACQLIEKHTDFSNTVLIGLQPRGIFLAQRIKALLIENYNLSEVHLGLLDITFYRDDFRRSDKVLEANSTEIDFLIENKRVVFIDDVLVGISGGWLTERLYSGKQLEVDHFVLDPDFRSHGIGSVLLSHIETWAKHNDCLTLELNAYVGNSRGHKFYFQKGYKILGFHFQKNL